MNSTQMADLRNSHEQYLQEKSSRHGNLAFLLSRKKKILDILFIAISGLLYSTIFPPLNFAFYAWIALVPLYFIVKDCTFSSAFRRGWLWGYFWAVSSFFWLREIEIFIPFLIALILAFFPAIWCAFIPVFGKYLYHSTESILNGFEAMEKYKNENSESFQRHIIDSANAFALASLWVFLEWVRTWFMSGLPWNMLSISQWQNPVIIQICDITGAYGVSFLIVFFNICVALSLPNFISILKDGKYRRPFSLYLSIIFIMIAIGYGSRKMLRRQTPGEEQIKIAVIQGDIPQCRIPTEEQAWFALDEYLRLTEFALISNPDIVVWPETAVPLPYRSSHPVSEKYRAEISRLSKQHNVYFLIGTIEFGDVPFDKREPDKISVHNSALLIAPGGNIIEKYHKTHLVPFGEYTPLGKYFEPLKRYFGMGRDLTAGKDYTIFTLPNGFRAGVNICYEDIFPKISREFTRKGADLILVLTNDAWYPKSSEPEQHFAHSVLRAVENRRPVVRAGNNNFSSVLTINGTVSDSITYKKDPKEGKLIPYPSKKTKGFAVFELSKPIISEETIYTKYGDVFILAISFYLLVVLFHIFWKWKICREKIIESFGEEQKS